MVANIMTMRTFAGLACRVIAPAGNAPTTGVVVLLHGFGAPGNDLVALAEYLDLPTGTACVFPEAPLALPPAYGNGRAWWMVDFERFERALMSNGAIDITNDVPDGLTNVRAMIGKLLDEVEAAIAVAGSRIVLGGFSQGAMVALDAAFTSTRPLAGVIALSGTHIAASIWKPGIEARAGFSIFQSHGRHDPILPFAISDKLHNTLQAAGLNVTWLPFAGAHEIPPQVLAGAATFIRARLP